MKFTVGDVVKRSAGKMIYKVIKFNGNSKYRFGRYTLLNLTTNNQTNSNLSGKENWVFYEHIKPLKVIPKFKF